MLTHLVRYCIAIKHENRESRNDRSFGGDARAVFAKAKKEAKSDGYAGPATFRPAVGQADRRRRRRALISALPAGRVVTSDTLFQGSREIGIEHYGSLYRLKITRQGKLILNK